MHDVFSFLTAYAEHPDYGPLLVAPLDLAEKCMALIEREAEHARQGRPARIIAKMNSLLDKDIIAGLYRASQAGVEIDLIVRGICVAAAGDAGHQSTASACAALWVVFWSTAASSVSKTAASRKFTWAAPIGCRGTCTSASKCCSRSRIRLLRDRVVHEILAAYLADNVKSRFLQKDGRYLRAWQSPAGTQQAAAARRGGLQRPGFSDCAGGRHQTPEEMRPDAHPHRSSAVCALWTDEQKTIVNVFFVVGSMAVLALSLLQYGPIANDLRREKTALQTSISKNEIQPLADFENQRDEDERSLPNSSSLLLISSILAEFSVIILVES